MLTCACVHRHKTDEAEAEDISRNKLVHDCRVWWWWLVAGECAGDTGAWPRVNGRLRYKLGGAREKDMTIEVSKAAGGKGTNKDTGNTNGDGAK